MSQKKAKIIKADKRLQLKAGAGEIAPHLVESAQTIIQNNAVDFSEIALPALSRLREAVVIAKDVQQDFQQFVDKIINPVMELKANGRMFKYDLVGDLASIMLGFLEQIHTLDKDSIEIIAAHERTLSAIVAKKITGDGGPMGQQLRSELEGACSRYYRKNPDKFKTA